jgi:hypothetical protein
VSRPRPMAPRPCAHRSRKGGHTWPNQRPRRKAPGCASSAA